MSAIMQPAHRHPHRVWVFPDSPLGKWVVRMFIAGVATISLAIVLRRPWVDLFGPSEEGWTLFWKLLPLGTGMAVGGVSGVMAIVAMVRDRAILLLVPAALGLLVGAFGLGELLAPH